MTDAPTAVDFCNVISAASHLGISGSWRGSAFRSHPGGIVRERMIFTEHHNINNYCDVKVITDPGAIIIWGQKDPAAHGNPYPKVDKGHLFTVYKNGRWASEGPWQPRILAILEDVKREIAEVREAQERDLANRREIAKREAAEVESAARAVFIEARGDTQ